MLNLKFTFPGFMTLVCGVAFGWFFGDTQAGTIAAMVVGAFVGAGLAVVILWMWRRGWGSKGADGTP